MYFVRMKSCAKDLIDPIIFGNLLPQQSQEGLKVSQKLCQLNLTNK